MNRENFCCIHGDDGECCEHGLHSEAARLNPSPVEDERVKGIRRRRNTVYAENYKDLRERYEEDIDYLLSLLPVQPAASTPAEKERNVSPQCWRDNHEACDCSWLVCKCECHRPTAASTEAQDEPDTLYDGAILLLRSWLACIESRPDDRKQIMTNLAKDTRAFLRDEQERADRAFGLPPAPATAIGEKKD